VRPPPPVLGTAQVASGLTGVAPVCVCRCGCCLDKETRKDRQANGPRGLLQGSLQEPFHEPTDMQPTDMHRMSVSMPPATAGTAASKARPELRRSISTVSAQRSGLTRASTRAIAVVSGRPL
jgi:hypothetical protein